MTGVARGAEIAYLPSVHEITLSPTTTTTTHPNF